ncbi:MAG: hypothetical protein C4527_24315 [Candidatus Omnitrophota bacterium]|jgi:lysophospholipase L1-like esterase|nr:MAG: hypothetical protein C4527_24315 [Candidatus Omnitrophota bacterium]
MAFLPQNSNERKRLVCILLLLGYIALEIRFGATYALRRDSNFRAFQWDSETLWTLKSSYQGQAFGQDIHTNSVGFRGSREYPVRSTHHVRIFTIGDSRTYGFAAKDDETFSAVLEEQLQARGVDAEVINAGVHGFTAVQCRGRLEKLVRYRPHVVIFAPGYNDRRYIASMPADSSASFRKIARLRRWLDALSWSNVFFGALCEVGESGLKDLQENPPGLDVIPVRVSEELYEEELQRTVSLCRENNIRLVLFLIYQDPSAYDLVERAQYLYDLGDPKAAIELIEEAFNTVPNRSYSMSRYLLGLCYRAIGEVEKSREAFATHRPSGSIFGEAVLRSERRYYDIARKIAEQHSLPVVDGKDAITNGILSVIEAEEAFRKEFIDECHYTAEGHRRMGTALAETLLPILLPSSVTEPSRVP